MVTFTCDACGETKQRTREVPFAVRFEEGEKTRFLNVIKRRGLIDEEERAKKIATTLADEGRDGELAMSCCRPCRDFISDIVDVGDIQVHVPDTLR